MRNVLVSMLLCGVVAFGVTVKRGSYELQMDAKHGGTLVSGGRRMEFGKLWRVRFVDGREVTCDEFWGEPWNGTCETVMDGQTVVLKYRSEALSLSLRLDCGETAIDVSGTIDKTTSPIVKLIAPDEMRYPLAGLQRMVFPQRGAEGHGFSFKPSYFKEHKDAASKYVSKVEGSKGYVYLYGDELDQLPDGTPATVLKVTEDGKAWLPSQAVTAIEKADLRVIRGPKVDSNHYDICLVESETGKLLTGKNFGGSGWLFRIGGASGSNFDSSKAIFQRLLLGTMDGLVQKKRDDWRGKKIAMVSLKNGPAHGGWTPVSVLDWETCLHSAPFISNCHGEFVKIDSFDGLEAALQDPSYQVIVNPYGEYFPAADMQDMQKKLDLVKAFVQKGGIWWETGGYSFWCTMVPQPFMSFEVNYSSAVADFAFADYGSEGVMMYNVQPVMRRPWDRERILKPTNLGVKGLGDAAGIWHGWHFICEAGENVKMPVWRLEFGYKDVRDALARYAQVNEIHGNLDAKLKNDRAKAYLKGALLIRLGGSTAQVQIDGMKKLPPHSLVHYSEYLHGGFDKQYPDHLPPRAAYGTGDDFLRFIMEGKKMGHLMMPYTNTSWWCIGPDAPTLVREGEAPLNRQRDGKLRLERYAQNEGYSLCFWHPAVQAAHRLVRKQMTEEYPSDVLFQDQVGARAWVWNYNEYEPFKASGHDGMHSLTMEDAEVVPMATEDGWDRVLNFETMLCGVAWGMIPADGKHKARHASYIFPEGDWEFFPILSFLGHDQCIFTTHDLGHFTNSEDKLPYYLAFGYGLSMTWNTVSNSNKMALTWVNWLDAIQKGVCAEYAGKKLLDFRYLNAEVVYSRFAGDVVTIANLSGKPVVMKDLLKGVELPDDELTWLAEQTLCPHGFYARAPKARVGYVLLHNEARTNGGFALYEQNGAVKGALYLGAGQTIELPASATWRNLSLQTIMKPDIMKPQQTWANGRLQITTPEAIDTSMVMPEERLHKSPCELGSNRQVVVTHFAGMTSETYHQDAEVVLTELRSWLQGSELEVIEVTQPAALLAMLKKPAAQRPFAIVNVGNEAFYGPQGMKAADMLMTIKAYVDQGGIWWAMGGYPFFAYREQQADGTFKQTTIGNTGASAFNVSCPMYAVDEAPRGLFVSAIGKAWFDQERIDRIERYVAGVQRPMMSRSQVTGLVMGGGDAFVGGVRGDGWGYLFSLGGFGPPMKPSSDIIAGVLLHLYTQPWEKAKLDSAKRLWLVNID